MLKIIRDLFEVRVESVLVVEGLYRGIVRYFGKRELGVIDRRVWVCVEWFFGVVMGRIMVFLLKKYIRVLIFSILEMEFYLEIGFL